jgi:hypothetical protein
MVTRSRFTQSKVGCMIEPQVRKGFLRVWEARMDQLVTHPVFGHRLY